MKTKRSWDIPQLRKYGTVEQLTELQYSDLHKFEQFISDGSAFGLFASIKGL
jgi:hypothetical protein